MSTDATELRKELESELQDILEQIQLLLGPENTARLLEEQVTQIRNNESGQPPQLHIAKMQDNRYDIYWTFYQGHHLEAKLSDILDVQAVMWDAVPEPIPPMTSQIKLLIHTIGLMAIELEARVVHVRGDSLAVQIFSVSEDIKTRLRARVEEIDELAMKNATEKVAKLRQTNMNAKPFKPETTNPRLREEQPSSKVPTFPHMPNPLKQPIPPPESSRIPSEATFFSEAAHTSRSRQTSQIHIVALEMLTWDVHEDSVFDILSEVAAKQHTGALELKNRDYRFVLVIDRGSFVDVERTPSKDGDTVERLLQSANRLTNQQVDQAREEAQLYGTTVADALVDLGFLDYSAVRIALKTRVLYLLQHIWKQQFDSAVMGTFNRLSQRYLTPPISIYAQLFSQIYEKTAAPGFDINKLKNPFTSTRIRLVDPCPATAEDLNLSDKQMRCWNQTLQRPHTLEKLLMISGLGNTETVFFLETLRQLHLLDLSQSDRSSRASAALENKLRLMYDRSTRDNPFEVFGLHWSTYIEEIDTTYEKLKEDYKPANFSSLEDGETRAQSILEHVENAYGVLQSSSQRRSARYQFVDHFKLESSVNMYIKQAESAKLRRDAVDALDFYRRALELDPSKRNIKDEIAVLVSYQAQSRGGSS